METTDCELKLSGFRLHLIRGFPACSLSLSAEETAGINCLNLFRQLSRGLFCAVTVKMWKLLVATVIVMNLAEAQRSSYAGRPGPKYKLLPRYRKNETESDLGTRGGQEQSDSSTTSTTFPPDLEGTLEDHRFVHRVSQWPEDRQPFWFKNRHAISSMRDRDIDGGNRNEQGSRQFQSSFQNRNRGAARIAADDVYYDDLTNDPLLLYLRRLNG